ncbi:MAG: competence/damage-inducible protein A [Candidatus Sericytochromatia bacterium]|nr:competence/damage-inducible protein A [Candidatus Sericytochromatia bacterium]
MRAEILCIGTELLIGQVVNTNATWLAQELATLGVTLHWVSVVGDNPERLKEAISRAAARSDWVITTGGLGPTADDITVAVLADLLGEPLLERQEVRQHLEAYFLRRQRPMAASNLKMALFPLSAELISNPAGTAFGMAVKIQKAWVACFPGVPAELRAMWANWAYPRLKAERAGVISSVLLRYVGIGESQLAEEVADLLDGENPTVAPYAGDGEVHLRVTARAENDQRAQELLAPVLRRLRGISPFYYGEGAFSLPAVVGELLKGLGHTVATAESCTGGLIASRLTDISGSSAYVKGGVVAYQTETKVRLLDVEPRVIEQQGVVSEAVARAMAQKIRALFGADWGVGITGWASGGNGVDPADVGVVWLAVAGAEHTTAECWRFGDLPREMIKQRASQMALDLLRRRVMACF